MEWSFFGTPWTGLRLMGGVAYVDPELTKTAGGVNQGKTATGVPKLQGKLGVEWDVPAVRASRSPPTQPPRPSSTSAPTTRCRCRDAWSMTGARAATTVGNHPVTLRANVLNVTNKAYWGMPQLTSLGLGAPRTFMLSATVDF